MRLIDADALEPTEMLVPMGNGNYECTRIVYMDDIDNMPTIEPHCEACEAFNKTRLLIPQPQRKKGKWINIREGNRADCDQCGQSGRAWMNFCFLCGADMRGE